MSNAIDQSPNGNNKGHEISKKYEIRNANGIVVGYRSPTQRSERKAVIATAQSQTDFAIAAVGASRTAWQREENAAASSMQRAVSPPPPHILSQPASYTDSGLPNDNQVNNSNSSTNGSHASQPSSTSSSTPRRTNSPFTNTSSSFASDPVINDLQRRSRRERANSEPGDPAAVQIGIRSNPAIPALKLGNVPADHGAASERVRRSARHHNNNGGSPSHQQYSHRHQHHQPSVIHVPRMSSSRSAHPSSSRSPRSPRTPRSPRRRRGNVRRNNHNFEVAATFAAYKLPTTSAESSSPVFAPAVGSGNGGGGGGGTVIVPASPRGLLRRMPNVISPRSRKAQARFEGMPDSVLLRIFAYLSIEDVVLRVSLLNYRCYQLSQDSSVFDAVDLSRQSMTDEAFVDLLCELGWSTLRSLVPPFTLTSRGLNALATCRSLRFLHLNNNPKISSHLLQRVVEYAEWQLRSIDLSGIIVTDEVVLALADRFDHCLESLTLVQRTPMAVTDRSVAHLLRQCHELRFVALHSCHSITSNAFEEISSTRLEGIDVAGCAELDDRFLKRLIKFAPQLRSLVLSGLTRISDKPLIELIRASTGLRDLALAECAQLTDNVLAVLTRKCTLNLRALDIVAMPLLTAPTVVTFVEKQCVNLQRARLSHSPAALCEPVLRALAATCANSLTFLDVRHGDDGASLSANALSVLPQFVHLQHLDISECGENVTAMVLGELFVALHWLRELSADRCTGLTNQLIRKLLLAFERDPFDLKLGSLLLLEHISLVGCESVSQEALLDAIRAHRPRCRVAL